VFPLPTQYRPGQWLNSVKADFLRTVANVLNDITGVGISWKKPSSGMGWVTTVIVDGVTIEINRNNNTLGIKAGGITATQIATSSTTYTCAEAVKRGAITPDEAKQFGGIAKADEAGAKWAKRQVMRAMETVQAGVILKSGSSADDSFDAVSSGFLLRNVVDVAAALAEQRRVVKPGGHVVCLETSPPPDNLLRPAIDLHLKVVIPALGRLISGSGQAYSYLPQSSIAFLPPDDLAAAFGAAGLCEVRYLRLMFGTIAIHVGVK
jgi:SAM-dependent methyltransferase